MVAYTLYYLHIDTSSLQRIILLIKISFFIQISVGLLQLTGIDSITNIFIPRQINNSISNWYIKGEQDIPGTFAFPVLYGYFILTSFIIIISTGKFKNYYYVLLILAVTFSFLSGSNIVILLIASYTLFYFYNFKSKVFFYWCSLLFVLVLFNWGFIVDLYRDINSVFGMFSIEYFEASARVARVGIFRTVPLLFDASLKEILIGFSYNGEELSKFLLKYYSTLPHVLRNNVVVGLEDVYWIAFLYYHGIIGLTLFVVFLYSLYKKAYKKLKNNSTVSFSIRFLFIAVLLSGFVNQSLYIKSFSFYFWLYIALAIKLYGGSKSEVHIQAQTNK
nr:hypothetical protein [uncultured Draconibacterium sp.]